jgi:hypothetical protein
VVLSGLESFVNYSITVRAVTVAVGPPSAAVIALTNVSVPDGSPTFVQVTPSSENLTAVWNEPLPFLENGPLTGELLCWERPRP